MDQKEEELKLKYHNVVKNIKDEYHINTLVETLQSLLEELIWDRKFDMAANVLSALMARANKLPETIFKAGITILKYTPSLSDQAVRFYRKMISMQNKEQALPMVVEFIIYYLKRSQYEEAKSLIESYWTVEPYNQTHQIFGYHGISCLALWQQKNGKTIDHFLTNIYKKEKNNDYVDEELYNLAFSSLEKALELKPECDHYLFFYIHLLLFKGKKQQANTSLRKYCKHNKFHPGGWKFWFQFLKNCYPDDKKRILKCCKNILALDPIDDEAFIDLISHYHQKNVSEDEIIPFVIERIVFCDKDTYIWKLLAYLLMKISLNCNRNIASEYRESDWIKRMYIFNIRYWNKDLVSRHIQFENKFTLIYRCICSLHIQGHNNYSQEFINSYVKKYGVDELNFYFEKYDVLNMVNEQLESLNNVLPFI